MDLTEARSAFNETLERAKASAEALANLGADADADAASAAFETASAEHDQAAARLRRLEAAEEVRAIAPVVVPDPEKRGPRIEVGDEPETYRRDNMREHSFFRDLWNANMRGDRQAAERLYRHRGEQRTVQDNTTTATDGGGFIPPRYLGDLYAPIARGGRPFADIIQKMPLPATGMTMTLPKVTTGVSVASQTAELAELSSTAIVEATVTVEINTIGGVLDTSLQLLERSDPPIDMVIFNDLRAAYDVALDTQLLSGGGTSGQHMGLRTVTGNIDVTYSDTSATPAELLPKIYDASQQIYSNRFQAANVVVMHPRRAAWMAAGLSSTFPLFQQGTLNQAAGTQDNTFLTTFAGLQVVIDPNIGTSYSQSGSTNEDEIYVLYTPDMYLAEGEFRTDTFFEPGSAILSARFRGFSYSAFICERFPKGIANIIGGGLAAPSF